jgi:TP901 family phage tail tape measure protein
MILETMLLPYITPFIFISMAVTMLVLRASGSRVFFDVVGTFQANKMIKDTRASATVMESLYMDALMGIQEAGAELGMMFEDLVNSTLPMAQEIENARVEFDKFLGEGEDLAEVTAELEKIGLGFGFAADEAFKAGARMAQLSGVLGGGTTEVGTEIGMMFGMISGMDTESAMQRLINLQQQTFFMTKGLEDNMTAQEKVNTLRRDSIAILDQLNTIENRSAATMSQITFVMNQFASQAHLTNESIASMAAMSATLIEAGEEQGKGGRALRMIYARLGANTNGARDAIEQLGISVFDAAGDMRPFSDLLEQLAAKYEGMNGQQQQALAQNVAGNRHYTRLIKLLENVDRVKELELEAMVQQMSAQDEVNRRLDSQIFAYEQSEAAIKNYSAAVGNALLPGLTSANNQHALFMKTLAKMLDNDLLGNLIGRMVMMSRVMSNFAGPVFQSVLALKNLQIALQTQHIVMRAFSGDTIVDGNERKKHVALTQQQANEIKISTLKLEENNNKLKESIVIHKQVLADDNASKASKGQRTRRLRENTEQLTINNAAIEANQAKLKAGVPIDINAAHSQKVKNNAVLHGSLINLKYTMSLGAIGSVMMMFAKNEKMMAAGLIITTAAMAVQMHQTYKSLAATVAHTSAQTTSIGIGVIQTKVLGKLTTGFTALGSAATYSAIAIKGVKIALTTLGIGAVIILVDVLLDKLGIWNMLLPDLEQNMDSLNNTMSDTGLVMEYLTMETSAVVNLLDEKKRKLAEIADATDETSKKLAEGYRVEIASLQKTIDMRNVEAVSMDGLAERYDTYLQHQEDLANVTKNSKGAFDDFARAGLWLADTLNTVQEAGEDLTNWVASGLGLGKLADGVAGEGFFDNFISGGLINKRKKAEKGMEEFVDHNADLMVFLEGKTFETSQDMIAALEDYMEYLRNYGQEDLTGGIGTSLDDATESLYNFNNAREELFFGFSSDKLTGDLVRQVKQQGVETLITSTEVIMTNNFNGDMSIPEIAQQLLDEIEMEGNKRGMIVNN